MRQINKKFYRNKLTDAFILKKIRTYVDSENRLKALEKKTENKCFQPNNSENIQFFVDEIISNQPKKNYPTIKEEVHHIDGIWSLDKLDLKDYGP